MNEKPIKTVFLGSGAFAPPVVEAMLEDKSLNVAEIVTQVDKPAGRKGILTPTPLGHWCQSAGTPFERVLSVNAHDAAHGDGECLGVRVSG